MKTYGIYNRYAEEYWTDSEGRPLSFGTKREALDYVEAESLHMSFDVAESTVKLLVELTK